MSLNNYWKPCTYGNLTVIKLDSLDINMYSGDIIKKEVRKNP